MSINNSFTFGHLALVLGSTKIYEGSTNTEGLALGQKVSDEVLTTVKITDQLVVSDLDATPNLSVGFQKLSDGNYLSIRNTTDEYETVTNVPTNLKDSEMERAQNLEEGFDVTKVTVREIEGAGTLISLADTQGLGERAFMVNPDGTLQAFLRGA